MGDSKESFALLIEPQLSELAEQDSLCAACSA
jgi:hypothetical protein